MNLNKHGREIIGKNRYPKLDIDRAQFLVWQVNPRLNDNQYSALVSFAVAIGEFRFMRSRVARLASDNQHFQAAQEILQWKKRIPKRLRHLRDKEASLYLRFVCIEGGKNGR